MPLTITAGELKKFAPKAKPAYVEALLDNLPVLHEAGITENHFRLAHFFATVGEETGGLTQFRESLTYTTARLRKVFPKRFGKMDEATLAELVANPVKLADAMYGGRLGNIKGTSDGYDFRGGGFLQVTGRANVSKLCAELGIPITNDVLDDPVATLRMACRYWEQNGCNKWADLNDVVKVAKVVNTGSATSAIAPVGLDGRKAWLAKALKVWSDDAKLAEVADVKAADLQSRTLGDAGMMQKGGLVTAGGGALKAVADANAPAPAAPAAMPNLPEVASQVSAVDKILEGVSTVARFAMAHWWIVLLIVGAVMIWKGRAIARNYLEDIRTGKRKPIFKVTKQIAEALH